MSEEGTVKSLYNVKQETFEGPLELLLSLIEQRKLFVNEISLAEVTNDYISYIKSLSNITTEKHIADVSYFLLISATLILIKSKSLLPTLTLTEDETEKINDLEKRIAIYKIIKDSTIEINNIFGKNIIFMPNERIWSDPIFSPDPIISIDNIKSSIFDVISRVPKKVDNLPEVEIKKVINIEEVMNNLTERIENAINVSFKNFAKGNGDKTGEEAKVNVIISFLAMLELVREGIVDVIQNSTFGDIEINKQLINNEETL